MLIADLPLVVNCSTDERGWEVYTKHRYGVNIYNIKGKYEIKHLDNQKLSQ